jgi:hypothetical protein
MAGLEVEGFSMLCPTVLGILLGLGSELITCAFSFGLRKFEVLSKSFDFELWVG